MNSFKTKLFACLMAVCMLVTLMPFAAFAEAASITEEYHLIQAAANGGTYTVDAVIDVVEGPIVVTKDLILYLNMDIQMMNTYAENPFEALFIVEGATLTIEDGDGCITYMGSGSAVKLIGAETQTAFVSSSGSWYGFNLNRDGMLLSPASMFYVEQAEGMLQPSIEIGGGYYQSQDTTYQWNGPLVSGATPALSIGGGSFGVDVSAYLQEGLVCLPQYGQYKVVAPAEEFSDAFTLTDKEGVLTLNRYAPETQSDMAMFIDFLNDTYGYPNYGPQEYEFFGETYDFEDHTMYVSRTDEYGTLLEIHLIKLEYVYDAAIKGQVDALIETLPEGSYDEEGWYIPYFYTVSDLELFNYWMTCTEENDWFNINSLINYSTEFKEKIDYRNYRLDIRAGDGDFFYTLAEGIAEFRYNGTVYAANNMGVRADHVLYVPDETEDTAEAMLAAVQKRLDDYLGAGTVVAEGLTEEDQEEIGYEGYGFRTVINDMTYYFLAERNSAKMLTPAYKSVDVSTEVAVLTEDPSVPLDTMIEVEEMTEGDAYDRIMDALEVGEHETYNIKLYSESKADYVTGLESGEFEVQIPLDEKFEGKELAAYYVDAEGKVTEHEVTVADGVASFATTHFSAYTLAVKGETAPCEHNYTFDEESNAYLCADCGSAYMQTMDLDGDGEATTADAIQLLRTIDKKGDLPAHVADINCDGQVKVFDAVRYLQLLNI